MNYIFCILLLASTSVLFSADGAGIETPYYMLKAARGNFSRGIYVPKVTFDTLLQSEGDLEVRGVEEYTSEDTCTSIIILFKFDPQYDKNPGETQKIFTVDIESIMYMGGMPQRFGDRDQALKSILNSGGPINNFDARKRLNELIKQNMNIKN